MKTLFSGKIFTIPNLLSVLRICMIPWLIWTYLARGDNPGAGSGDPEVVSPLSKLQGMIEKSDGRDVVILTQILDILKRMFEMFMIYKSSGRQNKFSGAPGYNALFDMLVEQNEAYKDTHDGVSAFA